MNEPLLAFLKELTCKCEHKKSSAAYEIHMQRSVSVFVIKIKIIK